jgi:hypothetical protein
VDDNIVPIQEANLLKAVLWKICELYDLLHDIDGHTEVHLEVIRRKAIVMLRAFKKHFNKFSKSKCSFPKFHFTLHLTWPIEWWGSLRAVDTCFGEARQSDVRGNYEQTTRQPDLVHIQLSQVEAARRVVNQRAAAYGISLTTQPRQRVVHDRLRGERHNYDLLSGLTTPHLRLPQGVRGNGIRRALTEYSRDHGDCFGDLTAVEVTLRTSMVVTATGSTGHILFHANPMLYEKSWYDYVSLLAGDPRGSLGRTGAALTEEGGDRYAFWAGRLQVFLRVTLPGSNEEEHTLALVHLYGVHRSRAGRAKVARRVEHDYCHDIDNSLTHLPAHSNVPWPYMEACVWPNGDPYMWMVETGIISTGMWVQPCFDNPEKFWFLRLGAFRA